MPDGRLVAEEWLLIRPDDGRMLGLVNIRLSIDDDYVREYASHTSRGTTMERYWIAP
ncbi:MAG: hypothetical protein FWC46_04265 [Actinomycetia bacterium]|nr:hypothetical protein [Actinomycetes bacterium]